MPIVQGTPRWLPAWNTDPAEAEALPHEGVLARVYEYTLAQQVECLVVAAQAQ